MALQPGAFQTDAFQVGKGQLIGVGYADGALAGDASDRFVPKGGGIAEGIRLIDGPPPLQQVQTWHNKVTGGTTVAVNLTPAPTYPDSLLLALVMEVDDTSALGGSDVTGVSGATLGAFTKQISHFSTGAFKGGAYTLQLSNGAPAGETITVTFPAQGAATSARQITIVELRGAGGIGSLSSGHDGEYATPTWAVPSTLLAPPGGWSANWSNGSLIYTAQAAEDSIAIGGVGSATPNGNTTKLYDEAGGTGGNQAELAVFRLTNPSTTTMVAIGATDTRSNWLGVGIEILGPAPTQTAQAKDAGVYSEGPVAAEALDAHKSGDPWLASYADGAIAGDKVNGNLVKAATPVMVQRVAYGSLQAAQAGAHNNFTIRLPNAVLAGNCIVLFIDVDAARSVSSITDDQGNSWPTSPDVSANGSAMKTQAFVLPSSNAGVQAITINFDANANGVHFLVMEFYNVVGSNAVGVNASSTTAAAPTVSTAAISPTSGNLVLHYSMANAGYIGQGSGTSAVTSWTAGSGWKLEAADYAGSTTVIQGTMNAYALQVRTAPGGSITPSATTTGTQAFNSIAFELKGNVGGTAPDLSLIHIKRVTWLTNANWNTSTWVAPFPIDTENLITATDVQGCVTATPTDSKGNTWTLQVAGILNSQPSFAYASSPTTGGDLVLTFARNSGGNTTFIIYAIEGARQSSPIAQTLSGASFVGNLNNQTVITGAPVITPLFANGLITVMFGVGQGPVLSSTNPAGVRYLPVAYTGETDFDTFNNADGYGCYSYGTDLSQQSWNWTTTLIASNSITGGIGVEIRTQVAGTYVEGAAAGDLYDAAPATGGTVKTGAIVEGPTAAEAEDVRMVEPVAAIEGPTAAEQDQALQKEVAGYAEGAVAAEAETIAHLAVDALIETLIGGDAYAVTETLAAGYVEGAVAADSDFSTELNPSVVAEAMLLGEAYAVVEVIPTALAEGPIAAEAETIPGGAVQNVAYVEGAVAAEQEDASQAVASGYLEGLLALEAEAARQAALSSYAEVLALGDAYAAAEAFAASIVEGALALEAEAAQTVAGAAYVDGLLALEAETFQHLAGDALVEGAIAGDAYAALQAASSAYVEGPLAVELDTSILVTANRADYGPEGPLALEQEAAFQAQLAAQAEGLLAGDAYATGIAVGRTIAETLLALEAEAAGVPGGTVAAYAEALLAGEATDARQVMPAVYAEAIVAAEAEAAGIALGRSLAETLLLGEAETYQPLLGTFLAEGPIAADAYASRQNLGAAYVDGVILSERLDLDRIRGGGVVRGLYAPTAVPTWTPTLMLSLGKEAQAAVVAIAGGPDLILTSPAFLGVGAPGRPRAPLGTESIWQYEGDFYRAVLDMGVRLNPGALYLAVTAGLVNVRLVSPGPVVYLALPDLDERTIAPLVAAANLLTLSPPPGPLPPGRPPWKDPAGVRAPGRPGTPLFAQVATPGWAPTLMLGLDRTAQDAVVTAGGGLACVLTSPAPLLGGAPTDQRAATDRRFWQYEGDFYAAARASSLRLLPGALYLGVVGRVVRVRLVAPGPVTWLGLNDLKQATLAPVVAACNALVP